MKKINGQTVGYGDDLRKYAKKDEKNGDHEKAEGRRRAAEFCDKHDREQLAKPRRWG